MAAWRTIFAILIFCLAWPANAQESVLFSPFEGDLNSEQIRILQQLESAQIVERLGLVTVDIEAFSGTSIALNVEDSVSFTISRSDTVTRSVNDFTWFGKIIGTDGSAVFVIVDDAVSGTIQTLSNLYTLIPLGDGVHAVVRADRSRIPPDHQQSGEGLDTPVPFREGVEAAAVTQVDVFVPYTPASRVAAPNLLAMIEIAIAESNRAYLDSGANVQLRLVGTQEIPYSENGKTFRQVINELVSGGSSAMVAVRQERDRLAADIVVLVLNTAEACGEAADFAVDAQRAYAVVYHSWPTGCLTGNYSFAHEIGHLFGARHDPAADPTPTPFSFGHGYVHGTAWRTILAYGTSCGNCPRVQLFSHPPGAGTPTLHDVARVHRQRVQAVADFRRPSGQLIVTPMSDILTSGFTGGVFAPTSFRYQLRASAGQLQYEISDVPAWLDGSPLAGTVTTDPIDVTFTVNANASALPPGNMPPAMITFKAEGEVAAVRAARASVRTPSIVGLLPPGGYIATDAFNISANGRFVAGGACPAATCSAEQPVVWNNGSPLPLPKPPSMSFVVANDVSDDGNTVVGTRSGVPSEAIRWFHGSPQPLRTLPGQGESSARGVSDNGRVTVGFAGRGPHARAVAWLNDSVDPIPMPSNSTSLAYAVSGNGSVIVGEHNGRAAIWKDADWNRIDLPCLDGDKFCRAYGVSGDGQVAVGLSGDNRYMRPVLWKDRAIRSLDKSNNPNGQALGVNHDGTVIVGTNHGYAFRWTETDGMWRLDNLLRAAGVDVSNWSLNAAWGVSADGTGISGRGSLMQGSQKFAAFKVELPVPRD